MEKHIYTKEEINQMFAEIAISQKETDKKFQKLEIFLDKIGKQLGSIGANNGAVAEEYFFYGFSKNMEVNNIKYDYIEKHKERVLKKLRGEYDVVLINSSSNLIIEVKYKLHPNDVKIFYEKKLPKFKKLFPEYKDYKICGAVAGMSVPADSLVKAEEYGLMCFTQAGENIQKINSDDLKLTIF